MTSLVHLAVHDLVSPPSGLNSSVWEMSIIGFDSVQFGNFAAVQSPIFHTLIGAAMGLNMHVRRLGVN